jgi:putative transposase
MRARKKPSHDYWVDDSRPIIVFLTVCTRQRVPWLAAPENHTVLRQVWQESEAWLVGRYVLMPDHLHLFAAPGRREIEFDHWVRYWKSGFSKRRSTRHQRWQPDHWDRRLRSGESYDAKWEYVRSNPARAGLVETPDEWPYQGELNVLEWW